MELMPSSLGPYSKQTETESNKNHSAWFRDGSDPACRNDLSRNFDQNRLRASDESCEVVQRKQHRHVNFEIGIRVTYDGPKHRTNNERGGRKDQWIDREIPSRSVENKLTSGYRQKMVGDLEVAGRR